MVKTAKINKWNDLCCPHCGVNIMTPEDCELIDGVTKCLWCGDKFKVVILAEAKKDIRSSI